MLCKSSKAISMPKVKYIIHSNTCSVQYKIPPYRNQYKIKHTMGFSIVSKELDLAARPAMAQLGRWPNFRVLSRLTRWSSTQSLMVSCKSSWCRAKMSTLCFMPHKVIGWGSNNQRSIVTLAATAVKTKKQNCPNTLTNGWFTIFASPKSMLLAHAMPNYSIDTCCSWHWRHGPAAHSLSPLQERSRHRHYR